MKFSIDTIMESRGAAMKKQLRNIRDTLEKYFKDFEGKAPTELQVTVINFESRGHSLRKNLIGPPPSVMHAQKNPNVYSALVWVEGTKGALVHFTATGMDGIALSKLIGEGPYNKDMRVKCTPATECKNQELPASTLGEDR